METARGRRLPHRRPGPLARARARSRSSAVSTIRSRLNGIRVELGEIEQALGSHPDVAQAVALLDGDAERGQSLWGFVRAAAGKQAPAEESWQEYLDGCLPAYMIPSGVIAIPAIPLSHSGKVDKAALAKLLIERPPCQAGALPEAGLETQIAQVWTDLLSKVESVGVIHRDDNFFALGGHSLLVIACSHRLKRRWAIPFPFANCLPSPPCGVLPNASAS